MSNSGRIEFFFFMGTTKIQMSTIIVMFLIAICIHGLPGEGIPKLKLSRTISKKSSLEIQWYPIKYKNDIDPVIGVKVIVWKSPCEIKTTFRHDANGTRVKVVTSEHLVYNNTALPQVLPEDVVIVKSEESSAIVPHIDPEVWYHVRALAFTKTEEGPHSDPVQFMQMTYDENDKKKSCERNISETLVEDEPLYDEYE